MAGPNRDHEQKVVAAFPTLAVANGFARKMSKEFFESFEWEHMEHRESRADGQGESVNRHGCVRFKFEDTEGDTKELYVEKVVIKEG